MAITDAYATAAVYRGIIDKSDAGDDAEILLDLTAMSRVVDKICDRHFTVDAAAVARLYYPPGYGAADPEAENPYRGIGWSRRLVVDDIADAATVVIKTDDDMDGSFADETAWASTDYELRPLNATRESEPRPYTRIHVPTWSTKSGFAPGARVEVTAKYGWPAIPGAIVRYTCWMTSILRLESPRATERIPEAMTAAVGESEHGRHIIDMLNKTYKRRGRLLV